MVKRLKDLTLIRNEAQFSRFANVHFTSITHSVRKREKADRNVIFWSLDGSSIERLNICCAAWPEAQSLDGSSIERLNVCCAA